MYTMYCLDCTLPQGGVCVILPPLCLSACICAYMLKGVCV